MEEVAWTESSSSMDENSQKENESKAESACNNYPQDEVMDVDRNQSLLPVEPSALKPSTDISIIKPIDRNVVHRICSGQVVVTLATAIKELVENSIDAGATSVDIRLTEYGSKSIEVTDNGCGVDEANFEGLGLKHHTSKIQVFEDLTCVETFGFRGEALSSLCALSSLTVMTKSAKSTSPATILNGMVESSSSKCQGFRIEYDTKGRIKQKTSCAREVGTTVILKNLFSTLPVRHTEFLKNLKREFAKMVNILYGYCLITSGVRISCTNQLQSGSMSKVLSVPASTLAKEKIVSLFGAKQLESLIEIQEVSKCSDENIMTEYGLTDAEKKADNPFTLKGYISLPYKGRCSSDRQFYFINSRPCEPAKISRIVNEVYHGYSRNQSPFIFLDIRTQQQNVDVNVTPDKRQIYLRNEKILYASIKETLTTLLATATSTFNTECKQLPTFSNSYLKSSSEIDLGNTESRLQVCPSPISEPGDDDEDIMEVQSQSPISVRKFPILLNTKTERQSSLRLESMESTKFGVRNSARNSGGIRNFFKKYEYKGKPSINESENLGEGSAVCSDETNGKSCRGDSKSLFSRWKKPVDPNIVVSENNRKRHNICDCSEDLESVNTNDGIVTLTDSEEEKKSHLLDNGTCSTYAFDNDESIDQIGQMKHGNFKKMKHTELTVINPTSADSQLTDDDDCVIVYDDEFAEDPHVRHFVSSQNSTTEETYSFPLYGKAKVVSCTVDWANIKSKCLQLSTKNQEELPLNEGRKFRAGITAAESNAAEQELKTQLTKDMFEKMQIVGQFNCGFIIAKHGPDLFIVDQHATDEKFNFEDLEKNLVLQSQRLISPIDLQLPAVSENIVIDNLDVFKKNGFDFFINEEESSTRRLQMTQIPHSKSYQFGKEDVEQLIFLLEDAPEKSFFRPSRVREMLASRACRKSVMIGTALNDKEMRRLVDHMGVMEQPWNCPHGRPTVRHLFNLNMIPHNELFKFNH